MTARAKSRLTRSLLKRGLQLCHRLSPSLSAGWAELLFRTPARQRLTRREVAVLGRGVYAPFSFRDGTLATWSWGPGPAVLLVHGWGGHTGRLSRFVEPLLESGFSVFAFDAPGHGLSTGRTASLPDFVEAICALDAARGPFTGVVGHSMGATAAALAMSRGLRFGRAVFLAPPADPEDYTSKFARFFGLPVSVHDGMKSRLEARYGVRLKDLRLVDLAPSVSCRLLVFHDRRDLTVPWRDGAAIVKAWPAAELITTAGLGHHRILRAQEILARSVAFLSSREESSAARDLFVPTAVSVPA